MSVGTVSLEEICADGMIPLKSGIVVHAGEFADLETSLDLARVHQLPSVDGVTQVHLRGDGYIDPRVLRLLSRMPDVSLATMIEVPASPMDLDQAMARADHLGLPVRLPGTDLLGSGAPRVQPLDDAWQPTTPDRATHVRVLPEVHLIQRRPGGATPAYTLPHTTSDGATSGRGVQLGLPAETVNARHGNAVLPLVGAAALASHGAVEIVGGYPELLRHLEEAPVGQRATVFVNGRAFFSFRDPDGVSLVNTRGQAATLPSNPRRIRVQSPRSLPSVVDQVPMISVEQDPAACLISIQDLASRMFPEGITAAGTGGGAQDDLQVVLRTTLPGIPDSQWELVGGWGDLQNRLLRAGAGATAFILAGRPGTAGHAFAAQLTGDGMQFADFDRPPGRRLTEGTESFPAAIDARVLIVDNNGGVTGLSEPGAGMVESQSDQRALVDRRSTNLDGVPYGVHDGRANSKWENDVHDYLTAPGRMKLYGGGQKGWAPDYQRLRFVRSKQNERTLQVLSHLSFMVHDTIRAAQDKFKSKGPRDREVQSMLVNGRILVGSNYNTSIALLKGPKQKDPRTGQTRTVTLGELLELRQSDDAIRRQVPVPVDGDELVGRINRARSKMNMVLAGKRGGGYAGDVLREAWNREVKFVDAGDAETLRRYLADPKYKNTVIMVQHVATDVKSKEPRSMHAELSCCWPCGNRRWPASTCTSWVGTSRAWGAGRR